MLQSLLLLNARWLLLQVKHLLGRRNRPDRTMDFCFLVDADLLVVHCCFIHLADCLVTALFRNFFEDLGNVQVVRLARRKLLIEA